MNHIFYTATFLAMVAICSYATYHSYQRGRYGWALFCMFWVGYNANTLARLV